MDPAIITSVQRGDNSDLMVATAPLWYSPGKLVLDVTYGEGTWWAKWQPEPFAAHDLYTLDGVDFRKLPEAPNSVAHVIYDPPYASNGGRPTKTSVSRMRAKYGTLDDVKGWQQVFARNTRGLRECIRVVAPKGVVLVKCMDFVEGGRLRMGSTTMMAVAEHLGMRLQDYFVHETGLGPQPKFNLDGTTRKQCTSRRVHSYLLVFKKPARWALVDHFA